MIFLMLLMGCASNRVIRDAETFKVETLAAEKRQSEAAAALFKAAAAAREADDVDLCAEYAAPALLIEAYGLAQAMRALYLAGLMEEDPGPSRELRDVSAVCGEGGSDGDNR